jgi:hypothetical protein
LSSTLWHTIGNKAERNIASIPSQQREKEFFYPAVVIVATIWHKSKEQEYPPFSLGEGCQGPLCALRGDVDVWAGVPLRAQLPFGDGGAELGMGRLLVAAPQQRGAERGRQGALKNMITN